MKMPLGRALVLSLALLVAALILSVAIGPVNIPPGTMWSILTTRATGADAGMPSTIVLDIRLPHAVLIMLTGAALAGSGAGYRGCSAIRSQIPT